MSRIAAVVLAAGESRRMGQPKALLRWRGKAFVTHTIERAAGFSPTVVVEGAHPLPQECVPGAIRVQHPNWRTGQLGSLQAGLRHVLRTSDLTGILVLTIDRPHLDPRTIAALVDAHAAEPHAIWQPAFRDEHGHPVLYPTDVAAALMTLDPATDSARTVLRQADLAGRRRFLDVDDKAVLDNIDSPEDLDKLPDWVDS